jgi:hypothetical protein
MQFSGCINKNCDMDVYDKCTDCGGELCEQHIGTHKCRKNDEFNYRELTLAELNNCDVSAIQKIGLRFNEIGYN